MATLGLSRGSWLLALALCLVLLPGKAAAFGAGNIPSIAQVEGLNWRHGDIEDMLSTIAFLHGKKWSSMLIKRTYFGNWLRDYSQAVDVGSLKGVNAETIRILVWVLSFMAFGYATEEFEVTSERLGVYRPEEHIDSPLGYAEGADARTFDPRLRGPVEPIEVEVDTRTGMKNYIANETGRWATSAGYLRFSFARSIHFGRVYTHGTENRGRDEDLCEALRCLGQALHCMEDFGAHSNYCELALRQLGYKNVFPHCGSQSQVHVRGKTLYPITTGTFGAVDFLHSVVGEATDHFTQSEVDEVDVALKNAQNENRGAGGGGGGGSSRGFLDVGGAKDFDFVSLVSKIPGVGGEFAAEAQNLKAASAAQEQENQAQGAAAQGAAAQGATAQGATAQGATAQGATAQAHGNVNVIPGMNPDFDPVKTARRIYPILQFRDKIVKAISRGIAKVPGLEKLLEHISETLTAFILGLLAPFIRPIIKQVSKVLKDGSSGVISASARSQLEPWDNPKCSDPTHSMLAKDHFTNILNSCAGRVATTILQYTVPRILYAWENPNVPVDEVVNDVLRAFHHPALRDENIEIQRDMFKTVKQWAEQHPRRNDLGRLLSSESVKNGKNHILEQQAKRGHGHGHGGDGGHGKVAGSLWNQVRTRDLDAMEGRDGDPAVGYLSTSPAPPQPQGFGYAQDPPSYQGEGPGPSGGYNASPPQPGPYGSGYGQPPPMPPQGYGGPPPGEWGSPQGPPPPGQYGGSPGYGGPPPYPPYQQPQYQQPPYQQSPYQQPPYQQPPYQQQPPPPWNQYPGAGPNY